MSPLRLIAILFIFGCTVVAWFILGVSVQTRSGETDYKLASEVAQLYGDFGGNAGDDYLAHGQGSGVYSGFSRAQTFMARY